MPHPTNPIFSFKITMTTIYFIRHADPNYDNHDDLTRELTPKGLEDRKKVTALLEGETVDAVLSSPFLRSIQTVEHFAQSRDLPIALVEDFRERKVSEGWIADFTGCARNQWADFDYKLPGGESLREVQNRNIAALQQVLAQFRDKTVVIGSHGTALSTIVNYYDPSFGYEDFNAIQKVMPWVVKFSFDREECIQIQTIPLPH